jgi:hypothetical protein
LLLYFSILLPHFVSSPFFTRLVRLDSRATVSDPPVETTLFSSSRIILTPDVGTTCTTGTPLPLYFKSCETPLSNFGRLYAHYMHACA